MGLNFNSSATPFMPDAMESKPSVKNGKAPTSILAKGEHYDDENPWLARPETPSAVTNDAFGRKECLLTRMKLSNVTALLYTK